MSPVRSTTCPYDPPVTNSAAASSATGSTFAEPTWGEVDPAAFERILVLSPHFDDAAMGAGHLLGSYADTTVVTVLGGRPPAYPDPPSDWDALGGFKAGDDVVARAPGGGRRRHGGAGVLLPLARVRRPPVPGAGGPAHARAGGTGVGGDDRRARPDVGLRADGFGQPGPRDGARRLAARAVRRDGDGAGDQPRREWFCYEDHGYKHIPGLLAWRVAKLLRSKPWPTPAIVPHVPDEERKRRAIWCYTSQIPPLEQDHALTARMEGRVPEQFWRLAPPPTGWEGMADFI